MLPWKRFLLVLGLFSSSAWATNYTNPAPLPGSAFSGYMAFSKIPLKMETSQDTDMERKILGIEYDAALAPHMFLEGQFGYAFNSETKLYKGSGFNFGGNFVYAFFNERKMTAAGYGGFEYASDKGNFKNNDNASAEATYTGVKLGGSFAYRAAKNFRPYGALEFFLMNSGKAKYTTKAPLVGTVTGDENFGRDSSIAGKIGLEFMGHSMFFRPELTFIGEQTFLFAVGSKM